MKLQIILFVLLIPLFSNSQNVRSMSEVDGYREISMSDATGKSTQGVYRYYAKGESEAFTGVLYANYDNGQLQSWQEFEDGIGQGLWINYYENGNYKEIGHYEQNRVEGVIQKFHPNGVLQAVGTYKEWRIKVKEWRYFDTQGKLLKVENYGEQGSLEEVEEYYSRGEISAQWYRQIRSKNGF